MNSALHQELMDPSKFNLIAAFTLIGLILLCILVIVLSALRKPKVQDGLIDSSTKRKGF